MAKDKDYIKLIHTQRWLRLRRDKLTAQPLCEECRKAGLVTAATEVHHRVPVEYGLSYWQKERLMFDAGNLVALCHDCHVKAHMEGKPRQRDAMKLRSARRRLGSSETHDIRGPRGYFFKRRGEVSITSPAHFSTRGQNFFAVGVDGTHDF